jgi:hypothetical protein
VNVCWLDERPDREAWNDVLTKLDSVGIETIQIPAQPKAGLDGWGIIVEVRTRTGYRAYSFWNPVATSTDPGERAAERVAAVLHDALNRRLARH